MKTRFKKQKVAFFEIRVSMQMIGLERPIIFRVSEEIEPIVLVYLFSSD
jgi:hypothetical protein